MITMTMMMMTMMVMIIIIMMMMTMMDVTVLLSTRDGKGKAVGLKSHVPALTSDPSIPMDCTQYFLNPSLKGMGDQSASIHLTKLKPLLSKISKVSGKR